MKVCLVFVKLNVFFILFLYLQDWLRLRLKKSRADTNLSKRVIDITDKLASILANALVEQAEHAFSFHSSIM